MYLKIYLEGFFCFIFANVCMYYMKTHGLKHVVIDTDVTPKLVSTIKVLFFGFFIWQIVTRTQGLLNQNTNVGENAQLESICYYLFAQQNLCSVCFVTDVLLISTLILWCFFLQDELSLSASFFSFPIVLHSTGTLTSFIPSVVCVCTKCKRPCCKLKINVLKQQSQKSKSIGFILSQATPLLRMHQMISTTPSFCVWQLVRLVIILPNV